MESWYVIAVVIGLILLGAFSSIGRKKSNSYVRKPIDWISDEEFQKWKRKLKPGCTEIEFIKFRDFLSAYGGGFVKREYGKIVRHEYLGKEKGDLKGIFYNIVLPSPHISTARKEEFRIYLNEIGVNGVDQRPEYETREVKLRNNKTDKEEYARKEVGNKGEQIVRETLKKLGDEYSVINGPVIRFGQAKREYDHIVVGYNGIFVIETKAFGMTDGKPSKAKLVIDEGDKWIVRKGNNTNEVKSPTEQILEEQKIISRLLASYVKDVYPIVSLSNEEISVKNNIELPYAVLKANEINDYIMSKPAFLNEADRQDILTSLNNCRQN